MLMKLVCCLVAFLVRYEAKIEEQLEEFHVRITESKQVYQVRAHDLRGLKRRLC